jgi:hypothetical protein
MVAAPNNVRARFVGAKASRLLSSKIEEMVRDELAGEVVTHERCSFHFARGLNIKAAFGYRRASKGSRRREDGAGTPSNRDPPPIERRDPMP